MDRRIPFFAGSALVCLLLVPLAASFAWVAVVTAVTYLVLALAVTLDWLSRSRRARPPAEPDAQTGRAGTTW